MNSLNSVLIEGVLTMKGGNDLFAIGQIVSDRHSGGVLASGRLADTLARECAAPGRLVRIVGFLDQGNVHAEYVEFKGAHKTVQPGNQRANDDAEYMGDHDSGL